MPVYEFELVPEYGCLYVQDQGVFEPLEVKRDDFGLGVASGRGVLQFRTAGDLDRDTRLVVEVVEEPPSDSLDPWDHVAEISVEFPTGRLAPETTTLTAEPEHVCTIAPGVYRARVYCADLATGWEPDGGTDHYRLVLWPAAETPPRLLKRYWPDDSG